MVLCHSMDAGLVVGIWGGEHSNATICKKNLFELLLSQAVGRKNWHKPLDLVASARAQEPSLWNFHNI